MIFHNCTVELSCINENDRNIEIIINILMITMSSEEIYIAVFTFVYKISELLHLIRIFVTSNFFVPCTYICVYFASKIVFQEPILRECLAKNIMRNLDRYITN